MDESHRPNDQINQMQKATSYMIPFIRSSRANNANKKHWTSEYLLPLCICRRGIYLLGKSMSVLEMFCILIQVITLVKFFTCCTLDICALYCLYISIKTSFLKRHNGWGYSNYDARHQFRDPKNPVNPKKEKYEGNNISVLPQKLPKTKAKITSLK